MLRERILQDSLQIHLMKTHHPLAMTLLQQDRIKTAEKIHLTLKKDTHKRKEIQFHNII